jgi:hypothetical protein
MWGCGSSSGSGGPSDAGKDGGKEASADAPQGHEASSDASDASSEASVKSLKIESVSGGPLQGAPGDAVGLQVLVTFSDGTSSVAAADQVKWTSPATVTALDPTDAGTSDPIPDSGADPNAFFVQNSYRITHDGVLFVVAAGSSGHETVTVQASFGDAGSTSASLTVLAAPTGDAAHGQQLFQTILACQGCHGPTGAGSPPVDGGVYKLPSGPTGEIYDYPAPPLNNTSSDAGPNLAADPAWSAGLLGMAAQADMDNGGVALRVPMPTFFDAKTATGKTFSAQDAADIYAWLKTQTH